MPTKREIKEGLKNEIYKRLEGLLDELVDKGYLMPWEEILISAICICPGCPKLDVCPAGQGKTKWAAEAMEGFATDALNNPEAIKNLPQAPRPAPIPDQMQFANGPIIGIVPKKKEYKN